MRWVYLRPDMLYQSLYRLYLRYFIYLLIKGYDYGSNYGTDMVVSNNNYGSYVSYPTKPPTMTTTTITNTYRPATTKPKECKYF